MTKPCPLISCLPPEVHLCVLTYLRSFDLSAMQRTCRFFNDRNQIDTVINYTSKDVYPAELTDGFDSPTVGWAGTSKDSGGHYLTYEALRNMELLVVARVLSRPEPNLHERREGCFYVSKSWCRTALRWLEVQQDEIRERERALASPRNPHSRKDKGGRKRSKKQERLRCRKLSDSFPPWSNINDDILCPHSNLTVCEGSTSTRTRRRLMDRQAWKVLKKLYPDSVTLDGLNGECLQCKLEVEMGKKNEARLREKETNERKLPLSCPLVRSIYTRSKGVPTHRLVSNNDSTGLSSSGALAYSTPIRGQAQRKVACPLKPGVYQALPRAWCHGWRKYLRTGEGDRPCAPDSSACLCDAHKLPLMPPHLEEFLNGETTTLLSSGGNQSDVGSPSNATPATPLAGTPRPVVPVGWNPLPARDDDMMNSLLSAGLSEAEVQTQRMAMLSMERQNPYGNVHTLHDIPTEGAATTPNQHRTNEQLDRENKIVVEILTDEEFTALEQWWPEICSSYALRFAVLEPDVNRRSQIIWSTPPCRECDGTGRGCNNVVVRNRARIKRSSSSR
eukprot:CAMPEP_0198291872 /NCGR_PEP_ID=MMETSP1449-20131203/9238_1 /TAXON_ID=420275 /ORGANISM="Attheya septentrionalis, Strain CCMP2084" /LENGTH=560 /DNA_ID=CAMNT_0043990557 /DNA_START=408 /DNA_END=2090 /DNA_ORIENTATION=-